MVDPFLKRTAVFNDKTTWLHAKEKFDRKQTIASNARSEYIKINSTCIDKDTSNEVKENEIEKLSATSDKDCKDKCEGKYDCSAYMYD